MELLTGLYPTDDCAGLFLDMSWIQRERGCIQLMTSNMLAMEKSSAAGTKPKPHKTQTKHTYIFVLREVQVTEHPLEIDSFVLNSEGVLIDCTMFQYSL